MIEVCTIELLQKSRIIAPICRPPASDFEQFMVKLEAALDIFTDKFLIKDEYIYGDFNLDLLRYFEVKDSCVHTMETYGFRLLLNKPTSATNYSEASMDHILTNGSGRNIKEIELLD